MSSMSFIEGVVQMEKRCTPTPKKPTKRQQTIMALREKLPELTESQKAWIWGEPFVDDQNAYYWKRGKVWCQCCGHVEPKAALESDLIINLGIQKYVCPECGRTLTLIPYQHSWKGYRKVVADCTVMQHVGDYTVFRTFQACRRNMLGAPTDYEIAEIYQNWVCPDGREVILARDHYYVMYHGESWNYYSDFKPRKVNRYQSTYEVRYNFLMPDWKPARIVRRNGWRRSLVESGVSPVMQVQNILVNPVGEMLVKNGQKELFNHLTRRGYNDLDALVPAIRICNRNRYHIKDASMWVDYIELLQYFGKDTHNAFYVCPQDLKRAHDRLMDKRERIEAEKKVQEELKTIRKKESKYKQMHGMYFGVCFGEDGIMVAVVSSVKEMAEEGAFMHHCVFTNRYYEKKDSLILSARDEQGNRLETIEVNLRTWSIMQSRGKFNHPTDRHDEIVAIVNKNMDVLKKIAV